MSVSWQRLRLPLLERLALAELAEKRGQSEESILAQLVREAVKVELTASLTPTTIEPQKAQP
jgi:hypothetical protein